jgi:tRNA pseudouridine38-40 synthase
VLKAEVVPDDFHARKSASRKQYTYTILNRSAPPTLDRGRVWHVWGDLHVTRMQAEARRLVGEHDFSAFRGQDCEARSTVKTIFSSEVTAAPPYISYRVIGRGFLKQMVRIIVGTLVDMGAGRLERSMDEILAAGDRALAGQTAPPQGLCLDWVEYSA